MPTCDGCGANIEPGVRECPYCGHKLIQHVSKFPERKTESDSFSLDRESGIVHFGDGITGARPPTGSDKISATYRVGGGKKGKIVCIHCQHENQPVQTHCEACGAELQRRILHGRRFER